MVHHILAVQQRQAEQALENQVDALFQHQGVGLGQLAGDLGAFCAQGKALDNLSENPPVLRGSSI
ncbi:MAG: hypothetical protein BWZ10_01132 [candidate division BRC1 bacterium ADurb.BinA364]|nr:MAG: hypothetical protein BWZ10_01132 [candidate division BRC1 bacterium ADurb.BinA364]